MNLSNTSSIPNNPFITGVPVPPDYFIGRETLVLNCYNRMTGPVPGGIALHGEEGLGRTSLLYYLRHFIQKEQAQTLDPADILVHLYCPDLRDFTPDHFFHSIIEEISETEEDPDLLAMVDELLDKGPVTYRLFRRFLRRLKRQGRSLILFLDGFAWIINHPTTAEEVVGDFLSHLRSLTNDDGFSFVLLVVTRERLDRLCEAIVRKRPESRFYNNFIFQPLLPFTDQEIDNLLGQALQATDVKFDQTDRALLHRLAGQHPALLQIAAFHLFAERRQGPLTSAVYKNVIKAFEAASLHRFQRFWQVSSELEKALLVFLILVNLPKPTQYPAKLTDEDRNSIYQTYETELTNLVERSLVQRGNHAYYLFSIIFTRWIAHEADAKAEIAQLQQQNLAEKDLLMRSWRTFSEVAPTLTLDLLSQELVPLDVAVNHAQLVPARYQQPEELGRGGGGTVYKAFDAQLQRPVAIKALHHDPAIPKADSHRRLLKEAQAASKLHHPHIVTIYNVDEANNQVFLVMEYVEGISLADRLKSGEPISFAQIIQWGKQAASALDYAHSQGVIHRDVKPANLMITTDNDLKLTDFGIAKVADDPETTHGTELKGTILYMSPEQVDQMTLDGRSDLFSLATVIFELVCGDSPWASSTFRDLMNHITTDPPRSLANYGISQAGVLVLDAIFQKALEKSPIKRFNSCADFMNALDEASQNIVIEPKPNQAQFSQLSKEALCCLCYDVESLKPVYRQLTKTTTKAQVVNQILETIQPKGQLTELLALARNF